MGLEFDSTDPLVVFGAVASIIFLGFMGNLVFSRFKLNDTLLLILVGVLLGPVFEYLDPVALQSLSQIVGPLALILILFDGGLALNLHDLAHGLGNATVLGLVSFVATTGLVGAVTAASLGIPFTTALILGAILGGTSALVVLPSLEHMKVAKKTGTILGLESALTDVLVVVVSFTLISIAAAGLVPMDSVFGSNDTADGGGLEFDAQGITSKLLITFAMSLFMGIAAGLLWLVLYPRVREKPFGYMLTLGFMFALYVFVEWILTDVSSGGGPLAVLAFGIMLGNYDRLGKLRFSLGDEFGRGMKRFQGEISFLVRTFFFIFLGAIVDLSLLTDLKILGVGLLIFVVMGAARYLAVVATTRRLRPLGDDRVLLVMMPRGLAAAVLAAEPMKAEIPGTESFVALAFLILVLSNLLATVGGFALSGGDGGGGPTAAAGASKAAPAAKKTPRGAGTGKAKKAAASTASAKKAAPKAAKPGASSKKNGKSESAASTPARSAPSASKSSTRSGPSASGNEGRAKVERGQRTFRLTGETEEGLERLGRRSDRR